MNTDLSSWVCFQRLEWGKNMWYHYYTIVSLIIHTSRFTSAISFIISTIKCYIARQVSSLGCQYYIIFIIIFWHTIGKLLVFQSFPFLLQILICHGIFDVLEKVFQLYEINEKGNIISKVFPNLVSFICSYLSSLDSYF